MDAAAAAAALDGRASPVGKVAEDIEQIEFVARNAVESVFAGVDRDGNQEVCLPPARFEAGPR